MSVLLVQLSTMLIVLSFALSLFRILKGPHFADRLAAFDLLTAMLIAVCAALSAFEGLEILFDVAVFVCLVSFIGTAGFAMLLDKQNLSSRDTK